MMYIGKFLGTSLDHINISNFHLQSFDGNKTPKKYQQLND